MLNHLSQSLSFLFLLATWHDKKTRKHVVVKFQWGSKLSLEDTRCMLNAVWMTLLICPEFVLWLSPICCHVPATQHCWQQTSKWKRVRGSLQIPKLIFQTSAFSWCAGHTHPGCHPSVSLHCARQIWIDERDFPMLPDCDSSSYMQ